MTERQLREAIAEYAQLGGWEVYWTWSSIHSPAGYPDLCMARERVVWAELKTTKGTLSKLQEQWRDVLLLAGAEWYLWRPAQWLDGTIDRILR